MIVREGIAPIFGLAAGALLIQSQAGFMWAAVPWLGVVLLCWLFRFPSIQPVADPLGVLSPVSGRVTRLGVETDPFRNGQVQRLRIRPTPPGITLLRTPVEGKVLEIYLRAGVFGAAQRPTLGQESPDCYALSLETDEGEQVLFAISSNWPVSRCSLDRGPGERAGQGQRAGFFYFASFIDVLLPLDSHIRVTVGQRVSAGNTQLARLPH